MTWFRVGGAGIPASLKNNMNSVLNKKFGTTGQNYPPNGWPADVNLLGPLPEKTVAGAIAHADDAADTVPVKSVICSIVPKQAGSGTPSPTNVRALSGYTGLSASQRGKNLLDSSTGTGTGSIWFYYDNGFLFRKGVTYTFSVVVPVTTGSIAIYGTDHTTQIAYAYISSTSSKLTFTPTDDVLGCPRIYSSGLQLSDVSNAMIEIGSSQTTFEAYNAAADVSDSWSSIGAIYGGERDLTEGTLKSKGFINVFDTVNENVIDSQYYNFNKINGQVSTLGNTVRITFNAKTATNVNRISSSYSFVGCNVAPHKFAYNDDTEHFYINTVFYLYIDKTICGETSSDVFDWLVSLLNNGTPLQVYMEYSTPSVFSNLSTYDFETLYAVNNFYSDIEGGQTQVTYRQDIALALQAVSSSRGLMMASRPVTQLIGEESDPDQVNELVENDEIEQEGEDDAR